MEPASNLTTQEEFENFELEIDVGSGQNYPLAVLSSPAGVARAVMHFPFDPATLQNQLLTLQNALRNPQSLSTEEQQVKDFGRTLFSALFPEEIGNLYAASLDQSALQSKGLRLKLRILPAELSVLPWEFLYDPIRAEYLCLSQHTPLIRYLEVPLPPQPLLVTPPLRILGMTVAPTDLSDLDVKAEQQRINNALTPLQHEGLVQLEWLPDQTWEAVQEAMRHGPWHIFHFIGHGGFDSLANEGVIAFANEAGQAHWLRATQLGLLLAEHRPLRLVVLNSCEGAQGNWHDVFSSTAASLIRVGLPAVVAMQYAIADGTAITFSHAFYQALADLMPLDAAVSGARQAVWLNVQDTLEWGIPVLFMRCPDGVLFTLPAGPPPPSPDPPSPNGNAFPNPYSPSSGALVLSDPLSANSAGSQWDERIGCVFTDGSYHVSISQQGRFNACFAHAKSFSNFTCEVQMTMVQGDIGLTGGGIIFRSIDDFNTKFYAFTARLNGTYCLFLHNGPSAELLAEGLSPAFHVGLNQSNVLAVVAQGSSIDLYVNQQQVAHVSDSTYSQGNIGLFTYNDTHGAEAAFSNAKVWTF